MRLQALWKAAGTVVISSGEARTTAQFVAEDFAEATAIAADALRHGWGSPDLQVDVHSVHLLGEVLLRERGVP